MESLQQPVVPDAGFHQESLFDLFYTRKWWIIAAVLIGLVAAMIYVHVAPQKYRITLLLVPSQDSPLAKSGMRTGGLSNLASLAGVSLPGDANALPFELFPEALTSRETAAGMLNQKDLVQSIFATRWDAQAGQWRLPDDAISGLRRQLKSLVGYKVSTTASPDAADLEDFLKKNVSIVRDRKRPIITLSVQHKDVGLGVDLLRSMVHLTDERLKQESLRRSRENVQYLQSRLAETTNAEYREFLLSVMADVEKQRMASSGSMAYVAEAFGQPTPSMHPVSPNIPMAYALGGILGMLAAIGAIILRNWATFRPRLSEWVN